MTKEERDNLAAHLESQQWVWAHDLGPGCETCGYGGGIEIDYEKLLDEIEAFSKTFKESPEP